MTQKIQSNCWTPRTERGSVDIFEEDHVERLADTPFDEPIKSAFTRLQEIMACKASVEAELEDLFARRRNHAIAELEKARKQLEFVDQEENRMKVSLISDFLGHPMVLHGSLFCLRLALTCHTFHLGH